MKLVLVVQSLDDSSLTQYVIDEQSMTYTYDNLKNIGYGNWKQTVSISNTVSNLVTVTFRVIPRMVSQTHVKLVYYTLISVKSIGTERSNGIQVVDFILDHTDKFYNIGRVPILDTYPITLSDREYTSSTIEVNYVYKDVVVLPSNSSCL